MIYILLQLQKVKFIGREYKVLLWCKKESPEAILFTPMQYILLLATVIKFIAHTTFNHIMYNIFDFLLVPAKIHCKFNLERTQFLHCFCLTTLQIRGITFFNG